MKLITHRDRIREVLAEYERRWGTQARRKPGLRLWNGRAYDDVHGALRALDLELATKEEVDRIMGNTAWTDITCSGCLKTVERAADIELYGAARSIWLCSKCLLNATALFAV